MPQENGRGKVKKRQQMIMALELRASGASFQQIGKALSVSKPRAFRIVRKALDDLAHHCQETAERVRQLELYRLNRIRLALDPKKRDPRVADTLIRIMEREAKLMELEDENRELREILRFKSDAYEFRTPFWYDKASPGQPLCPRCYAKNIVAPMGEPGQGCASNYRVCLVCREGFEISKAVHSPPPRISTRGY